MLPACAPLGLKLGTPYGSAPYLLHGACLRNMWHRYIAFLAFCPSWTHVIYISHCYVFIVMLCPYRYHVRKCQRCDYGHAPCRSHRPCMGRMWGSQHCNATLNQHGRHMGEHIGRGIFAMAHVNHIGPRSKMWGWI